MHRQQGPLRGSSSPLLHFEPARVLYPYNIQHTTSRLDGRLKLTASAFNRLWISMPAVLVTVPTVMQNSLHPLSTSSTTARHLLDFMVQGKITKADTPTIRLDATPSGLSVPPSPSSPPHFHAECPFCRNPLNLSWRGTGTK